MNLKLPLILDGATGTQLQKRGMPTGVSTELWVLEHPEVLQEVQKAYVEAGSDVVYAPTFSASPIKLAAFGLAEKCAEVNKRLVEISRQAVGEKALIAGDMAPTGKFLAPMGDTSFEALVDCYTVQARALEEAGVDLFVIETTMTLPEARAALLAVKSVSQKPVLVTFTVEENGRTLTGTDCAAALLVMQAMGADAFGLNCSTGPEAMLKQLERLKPYAQIPLIAKPNAGLPQVVEGKTVYDCPPDTFTAFAGEMAACGVRIFGGCCGTEESHIAALRQKVDGVDFSALTQDCPCDLLAATEKDVFLLEDTEDVVEIDCSEDLLDDLLDTEEEDEPIIQLTLHSQDDLEDFAEAQYAVKKPLLLLAPDGDTLEAALRLYQGLALTRDNGSVSPELLLELSRKYGVRVI